LRARAWTLGGVAAAACATVAMLAHWIEAPRSGGVRGDAWGARALSRPGDRVGAEDVAPADALSEASVATEPAQRRVLEEPAPTGRAALDGGGGSWRGRVVDGRDQQPIEDVAVALIGAGGRVETRTGDDGRFELEPSDAGRWHVELVHEHYATAVFPDVDPGVEREFELWPAGAIEGSVRGVGAHDPTVVDVGLWSVDGPESDDSSFETTRAAADGSFRFDGLTSGAYALAARAPGAAPTARGGLLVELARTETVELELARGARLSGRVLERSARTAVGEARLTLEWVDAGLPPIVRSWLERGTTSTADGRYAVDGLAAGAYEALVVSPWGSELRTRIDVDRPGLALERDFLVARPATLAGRVRSPDGSFAHAARVALFATDDVAALANGDAGGLVRTVAENGVFELTGVPAGEHLLLVAFPPEESELCASRPRRVRLRPEQDRRDVDLELGRGCVLRGVVEDPDGVPIEQARVASTHRSSFGSWDGAAVSCDDEGRFTFPPLPAGRVTLTARADGFAAGELRCHLRADGERRETIRLFPAGVVEGVVVDAGGRGVPWARVRLRRRGPTPAEAPRQRTFVERAGASGAFAFEGVPEGRWKPDAWLDGWTVAMLPEELEVPASAPRPVRLSIEMNPAPRQSAVVRGRVELDGLPPSGLTIGGAFGVTVVDGGEFTISGMAPGRSRILVRADRAVPRLVRLDLTRGSELDVGVIELVRGTEVLVRVRDRDGRRVRKAKVRLEPLKPPQDARDARGRYGVPTPVRLSERRSGEYGRPVVRPGRWRVVVEARNGERSQRIVEIRDRKRQVVPVVVER